MLPWTSVQEGTEKTQARSVSWFVGTGVGAGQVLPLSRMTAATVPLQARYGELSLRSRSKPALTTAAQRCSCVRTVSVQQPGDSAGPTSHASPPLPPAPRWSRHQELS